MNISDVCLGMAVARDLPDIEQSPLKPRRPAFHELDVFLFPQTWSSTALGFGGVGGQSMTKAVTTVIMDDCRQFAAVYFNLRLAYVIEQPTSEFFKDLGNFYMAEQFKSGRYRGKK